MTHRDCSNLHHSDNLASEIPLIVIIMQTVVALIIESLISPILCDTYRYIITKIQYVNR